MKEALANLPSTLMISMTAVGTGMKVHANRLYSLNLNHNGHSFICKCWKVNCILICTVYMCVFYCINNIYIYIYLFKFVQILSAEMLMIPSLRTVVKFLHVLPLTLITLILSLRCVCKSSTYDEFIVSILTSVKGECMYIMSCRCVDKSN